MRTSCPECGSFLEVAELGTDPGAHQRCPECGSSVRPGLFRCPHCAVPLRLNRHLLPPGGARGECPACRGLVQATDTNVEGRLPSRGPAPTQPEPEEYELPQGLRGEAMPAVALEEPAPFAEAEPLPLSAQEPQATARVDAVSMTAGAAFGGSDIETTVGIPLADVGMAGPPTLSPAEEAEESPASGLQVEGPGELPEPDRETTPQDPSATQAFAPGSSPVPPAPRQPAPTVVAPESIGLAATAVHRPPRSRPAEAQKREAPRRSGLGAVTFLGFLLGGGLAGGGAYVVGSRGLWSFPAFPFPQLGLPELIGWTAILGLTGALIGALVFRLARGRR